MSTEPRCDPVSSSSSYGKTSKWSECHKSQKQSRPRQQVKSLDIVPATTRTPQSEPYCNLTPVWSNIAGYCQSFLDSSHISDVCVIDPPNIRVALLSKRNVNKKKALGNKSYCSTNRSRLQCWEPVWAEICHIPAQLQTNCQQHSRLDHNQPGSSTQTSS